MGKLEQDLKYTKIVLKIVISNSAVQWIIPINLMMFTLKVKSCCEFWKLLFQLMWSWGRMIYSNAVSKVNTVECFSDEFCIGLHNNYSLTLFRCNSMHSNPGIYLMKDTGV